MDEQKKLAKIPIVAAGIVGVLLLLVIFTYQLRVTELAVITTFGESSVVDKPGLHWRLPWPVQKVLRFDKRKQLYKGSARETTTRDRVNLIVKVFGTWRISNPLLFFDRVGSFYEAESILASLIKDEQESVIRSRSLSDFVSGTDNQQQQLSAVENELQQNVNREAIATFGIEVDFIGIAQLSLHESNTASVFQRMKQEQAKIASQIQAEGEKEAKIIRDNANSVKAQKVARAEADAKRIRGEALIKAAEQYDQFSEDLEFAIFLRKLDALEETMKTKTTIILDPSTPPYDLLKYENVHGTK